MTALEKLTNAGLVEQYEGIEFDNWLYAEDHEEEDSYVKLSADEYASGEFDPKPVMSAADVLEDIQGMLPEYLEKVEQNEFVDQDWVEGLKDLLEDNL